MPSSWELPGHVVGDLIGFGPHGDVWRGRVADSGEPVALKRLRLPGPESADRLRLAAHTVASVAPEHVTRLRAVVPASNDDVVLVVDLAEGGSLRDVLARRGRLAPPEVVTLLAPLARTLAAAHGHGIVHGAVHATNVVFSARGRPLLTDIGLATVMGAHPSAAGDVRDLALLGAVALGADPTGMTMPAGTPLALADVLLAALDPDARARPDAAAFADAVLASAPAAPVGLVGRPRVAPGLDAPRPRGSDDPREAADARRRRMPSRPAAAGLLAVGVLAAVVGAAWGRHGGAGAVALPAPPVPTPSWRDVVARLDGLRAQAFRAADPRLLDAVYAPGSAAHLRDEATLAALVRRGLRARAFDVQVEEVTVEAVGATSARLRVVDTMTGYDLVDGDGRVVSHGTPRPPRAFELVLRRVGAAWRVQSVVVPVSRPAR